MKSFRERKNTIKFHLSPWEKHYWTRVVSQEYIQYKHIRNLEGLFSQVG